MNKKRSNLIPIVRTGGTKPELDRNRSEEQEDRVDRIQFPLMFMARDAMLSFDAIDVFDAVDSNPIKASFTLKVN